MKYRNELCPLANEKTLDIIHTGRNGFPIHQELKTLTRISWKYWKGQTQHAQERHSPACMLPLPFSFSWISLGLGIICQWSHNWPVNGERRHRAHKGGHSTHQGSLHSTLGAILHGLLIADEGLVIHNNLPFGFQGPLLQLTEGGHHQNFSCDAWKYKVTQRNLVLPVDQD